MLDLTPTLTLAVRRNLTPAHFHHPWQFSPPQFSPRHILSSSLKDIDSVDNGIIANLFHLMNNSKTVPRHTWRGKNVPEYESQSEGKRNKTLNKGKIDHDEEGKVKHVEQQQQKQQQQQQQQEIDYQTQYESETNTDSHLVVDNLEQQHNTGIISHSDALLIDEEEYEEVSDVSEMEDDFVQDDIMISGEGGGEGVDGIRDLEEHEDAVVRLMATLTPVVKKAYTAMSIATSTAGVVLSHELLTHFALFEEAFKDAKKAFALTDAAENQSGSDPLGPADMERQLYGVSNAVIRAEVAAKAVIEEAEMLVENFNK